MFRSVCLKLGVNRCVSTLCLAKLCLTAGAMLWALSAWGLPSAHAQTTRGGGGGDIIVFDIVDSAHAPKARPVGGGGGVDIVVFDIVDSFNTQSDRAAASVGTSHHLVTSESVWTLATHILLLCESDLPGVYEALVVMEDLIVPALACPVEGADVGKGESRGQLMVSLQYSF